MNYDLVIELLEKWAENGPEKYRSLGICGNLDWVFNDIGLGLYDILQPLWLDWEHYSGISVNPVPGKYRFDDSDKWIGKEGELRKDLCRHLAEKFKEMS